MMKFKIITTDSLGTRSMATYVETKDLKLFIDPGVALAPNRHGYPPHPIEVKEMEERWKEVVKLASKSNVIVVSHYHYDHHNPFKDLQIYDSKIVYLKHPTKNINHSQKERAKFFINEIKDRVKELNYADGNELKVGKTKIIFSEAVPHGINSRLGFVVETFIKEGDESFLHTSDVEGPALDEQVDFILENKPKTLFIDGPLSYIMQRYGRKNLEKSVENLIEITKVVKKTAIDHHFLRDIHWKEKVSKVYENLPKNHFFGCGAELEGKPIRMLEANRTRLYKEFPVKKEEREYLPGVK